MGNRTIQGEAIPISIPEQVFLFWEQRFEQICDFGIVRDPDSHLGTLHPSPSIALNLTTLTSGRDLHNSSVISTVDRRLHSQASLPPPLLILATLSLTSYNIFQSTLDSKTPSSPTQTVQTRPTNSSHLLSSVPVPSILLHSLITAKRASPYTALPPRIGS